MREPSKLPKTFIMSVEDEKRGTGYVRFKSRVADNGDIKYDITLVKRMSDASRYVTLDNSRLKAKELKSRYNFENVRIIDEATKKSYKI